MGSRKSADFLDFAGSGKQVLQAITQTRTALESKRVRIAVATAVDVLAVSNPTIATLVMTYKVSKILYRVSRAAGENYKETHDPSKAIAAAAKETLKVGVSEVVSQTIGTTIDTSWSAVKVAAGIKTNELQDRILTSATKNTIKEVILPDK